MVLNANSPVNPSQELAIHIQGLTKSYGKVPCAGLNWRSRGEIFGFLGPNGAGKTTTIRCLLDLIRPDGARRSSGFDPQANPVAVRPRGLPAGRAAL